MNNEEYIYERGLKPTIPPQRIYQALVALEVEDVEYRVKITAIIDHIMGEGARFPAQELAWLKNKVTQKNEQYDRYKLGMPNPVKLIDELCSKKKKLPSPDDRYMEYE